MFYIGPFRIDSPVLLAPMAGVSDAPFRRLCRGMGAGLTTSEMLTADTSLWQSRKSSLRLMENKPPSCKLGGDASQAFVRSVQIAGSEPSAMADAARAAVDNGAQLVDINMGCPAKKVCNKAAGSALLRDESLVTDILQAVVQATEVPVTLKIRTGWCPESRNGVRIARIAEDTGIQALAVHGRTRACRFNGEAEYQTIAAIAETVQIPVIANGDIDSPQKAAQVLKLTGAAAVMVGRPAQGQPWLIRQIETYLRTGSYLPTPASVDIASLVDQHLADLYEFYGDYLGVRIARKHIKWYWQKLDARFQQAQADVKEHLRTFNAINSTDLQQDYVRQVFERLINREDIAA